MPMKSRVFAFGLMLLADGAAYVGADCTYHCTDGSNNKCVSWIENEEAFAGCREDCEMPRGYWRSPADEGSCWGNARAKCLRWALIPAFGGEGTCGGETVPPG